jgi:C4-dicarboxylate-specific signal transduction histidine kinase
MRQMTSPSRKSLPLSIRLSLWLIGVAIVPLLLALLISEIPSRTMLINQASTLMTTDAKSHAKLIDNYLANKEAIVGSLSNDPNVRTYLMYSKSFSGAQLTLFIQDGLALEKSLYPEVSLIEFFTPQGTSLLNYSMYGDKPQLHGKDLVPAEYLQRVLQDKQFFSGVYYDAKTHISTTNLYTPVAASATDNHVVGFVRDTLKLDSLWSIVNSEKDANGSGSYAMLLDQNGVRIIDPNPQTLFTASAPLSPQTQQQIQTQDLYGLNTQAVPIVADKSLQSIQNQSKPPASFQEVPPNQQAHFQVTWQRLATVPWMYFVLTPVNIVEAVADQQLLILSLTALLVLVPAAIIGWLVGNRVSTPILSSTESLAKSSAILNQLAKDGEDAASEQVWIVDASKVGLKSIEYYTHASKQAIGQLVSRSEEFPQREHRNQQAFQQDIDEMTSIGGYLKKAIAYQNESNQKVSKAIGVTDEVASQLVSGAKSTKEVADELDRTVEQLRGIIGDTTEKGV